MTATKQHQLHAHTTSNSTSTSRHQNQGGLSSQWSHMKQRIRRNNNRLVGPIVVCALAMTLVGMPCCLYHDSSSSSSSTGMIWQYLPLVEAVPFFRRTINGKPKTNVAADNNSNSALGVSSATVETELLESEVEVDDEPNETNPAEITKDDDNNNNNSNNNKKKNKRNHSDLLSSSRTTTSTREYNFPLMNNHETFETNPEATIPVRYLAAHKNDDALARQATIASLKWRRDHNIDTILARPNPNYDVAKRVLPHYFIGTSELSGHVVFVQRPGLADLELALYNDVSQQDMLDQYAFVFEYCWNILHPNNNNNSHHQTDDDDPNALMIGIMDLQGLDFSVLRKRDLQAFVKEFVGMIDAHYPTRAYKTYLVNAPKWFSAAYKIVSPMMRESTKEKIVLFSAGPDQDAALRAGLGDDMAQLVQTALRVPTKEEWKDKDKHDLSLTSDILLDTDMERQIRDFVVQRVKQEGLTMKAIIPLSS